MRRLAIIGCGDLGQQLAYHAATDRHYEAVGFFDDFQTSGAVRHGLPVLGKTDDIEKVFKSGKFDVIMIALGYRHFALREELFERFKELIPFGSVLHSSSYIDSSCKIGKGVFIYPGCTLDMNAEVKDNVTINVGCIIAHDTTINEHSFLSPAVKIAGFVNVGKKVSLGIGTTIIDNINIVDNVRTGGGTVVIKNLENPGLYVGVPAILKKN